MGKKPHTPQMHPPLGLSARDVWFSGVDVNGHLGPKAGTQQFPRARAAPAPGSVLVLAGVDPGFPALCHGVPVSSHPCGL